MQRLEKYDFAAGHWLFIYTSGIARMNNSPPQTGKESLQLDQREVSGRNLQMNKILRRLDNLDKMRQAN